MTRNALYQTIFRPVRAALKRQPQLERRRRNDLRLYDGLDLTPRAREYQASAIVASPFGGLHGLLIGDSNFHLITRDDIRQISDKPVTNWAQGGSTPEDWLQLFHRRPDLLQIAAKADQRAINIGGNIVLGLLSIGRLADAGQIAQDTIRPLAELLPYSWWATIPPIHAEALATFGRTGAKQIQQAIAQVNTVILDLGDPVIELHLMTPTAPGGEAIPGVLADFVHWGGPAKAMVVGVLREVFK